MDIDAARHEIQQAPDVPALSDVLLDLLTVVSQLDDDLARMRQRVEALERQRAPLSVIGLEKESRQS